MDTFVPEAVIHDGVVIPTNVRPTIVLSGNDFEMGRQHAAQLVHVYGPSIFDLFSKKFSESDIAELRGIEQIVQGFAPEYLEQFAGMVAGADSVGVEVSYDEILAKYTAHGLAKTFGDAEAAPDNPTRGCSGFAAWGSRTTDGRVIASSSWDSDPTPFEYVIVAYPRTGNAYVCNAHVGDDLSGIAWFPGMNNRGLTYVHHGSGQAGDEPITEATIGQSLYTGHTLRFASNAEAALEMQLAYPEGAGVYPPFGTNTGGLWVDTNGDAFDIECRNPLIVRRAGDNGEDDFLYATNNSISDERMPTESIMPASVHGWPLTFVPHGGWEGMNEDAVKRNLFIYNMLSNYKGSVDVGFVEMMWRFTGRAPDFASYAEAVEQLHITHGEGWDSKIAALDNATVNLMQPSDGDDGLYYVCNGPLTRQSHEIPDFSFWIPEALNAGFTLKLAADVDSSVEHAYGAAMTELTLANRSLRNLELADAAYGQLAEKFDDAVKAWYVADHHARRATKTDGDTKVFHAGKALRRFAVCQAYGRHIRENLDVPARVPEELGLPVYWGDWASWESWQGSR
ncbi:hypothetical protein HQO83_07820 [Rhodococcus fascians]|nr:hypothetical protein [Rhodococcus fascians]